MNKMAASLLSLAVTLVTGTAGAQGGSADIGATLVNAVTALTPLFIAVGSGVWVVYTHFERKKNDPDEERVVQGQPIPVPTVEPSSRGEWTWQDELHSTQDDLYEAGLREDAYREALIRAGLDPRQVLLDAGLLPQRVVRHPQGRRSHHQVAMEETTLMSQPVTEKASRGKPKSKPRTKPQA